MSRLLDSRASGGLAHCCCCIVLSGFILQRYTATATGRTSLKMLQKSKWRLINWCPSISCSINGEFPKLRHTYRNLLSMFFNPDPACRLRLVPIEGIKSQDLFNSCFSTDMDPSRYYFFYHANHYQPCRSAWGLSWVH
jgi:hypothetical protein